MGNNEIIILYELSRKTKLKKKKIQWINQLEQGTLAEKVNIVD